MLVYVNIYRALIAPCKHRINIVYVCCAGACCCYFFQGLFLVDAHLPMVPLMLQVNMNLWILYYYRSFICILNLSEWIPTVSSRHLCKLWTERPRTLQEVYAIENSLHFSKNQRIMVIWEIVQTLSVLNAFSPPGHTSIWNGIWKMGSIFRPVLHSAWHIIFILYFEL